MDLLNVGKFVFNGHDSRKVSHLTWYLLSYAINTNIILGHKSRLFDFDKSLYIRLRIETTRFS